MKMRKKNPLGKYDNQVEKVEQSILVSKKRLEQQYELKSNILSERRDAGIKRYLNRDKRETLLNDAEQFGYSHDEIDRLRNDTKDWNQDNISNEIIDDLVELENYVLERLPYKERLLYYLGGIIDLRGGDEDEN